MAGGSIKYNVGFNVDTSSLGQLKSSLQEIKNMTTNDFMKINGQGMTDANAALLKLKETANQVDTAFDQAFNRDLGTLNVTKFKQTLDSTVGGIQGVKTQFDLAGTAGQTAFRNLTAQVLTTNLKLKETSGLLTSMANTMANTIKWSISSSVMNTLTGSVRKAYGYVKNLDKSLNDIRIVTGKSAEEMDAFAVKANNVAKALGQTTTNYTNAALIYYQQGLKDVDVEARANVTLKAANVTGQSADEVSEQLTAVWNGYKVSAEEAELYIDKLSAVAANSASNLEELSIGMSKVASAANAMGVDVDQLNAQLSTIISVTRQAPESVGTALKTIYARMSDLKLGGSDEDGIGLGDVSGTMESMGIDVLDATGNLRDMGDVIEDVAKKWDTWTEAQKTAMAQAMAGKRQYNNLVALFENWDMYEKSKGISETAEGTLQTQEERYEESTAAHLKTLKAEWEDLYDSLLDADAINGVADAFSKILSLTSNFVDGIGGGKTVLLALGSVATRVFSRDMAQGIVRVISNFKDMNYNAQQVQTQLEIIKTLMDTSGKPVEGVNELATMKNQLISFSSALTKEQQAEANTMIKTTAELYNQKVAWDEKRNSAQAYFNEIQNSKNFKSETENNHGGPMDLLNLNIEKDADGNIKDSDSAKVFQDNKKAIEEMQKSLHVAGKDISSVGKELDLFKGKVIQGTATQKDFNKISGKVGDIWGEVKKNLKEGSTAYNNTKEAVRKMNKVLNDKNATPQQKYLEVEAALEELSQTTGMSKEKIKELLFVMDKEGDGASKKFAAAIQAARKEWENFVNKSQTIQMTQQFMHILSGIGQITAGLRSLFNVFNVLKDDSLSAGEKALQVISGITMALPMIFNGGMAAAGAIYSIIGALILKSGATGIDAEMTTADMIAHLGLAGAIKIVGKAMLASPIFWWIAALALVGGAIYAITKAMNKKKAAMEKANKSLKAQQEHLKKVKAEYDNLKQSLDSYSEAQKTLDKMVYGTLEWKEAVQDLNNQVLTLLQRFPQLSQYVSNIDGILTISEEGQQVLLDQQFKAVQFATSSAAAATVKANEANKDYALEQMQKDISYVHESTVTAWVQGGLPETNAVPAAASQQSDVTNYHPGTQMGIVGISGNGISNQTSSAITAGSYDSNPLRHDSAKDAAEPWEYKEVTQLVSKNISSDQLNNVIKAIQENGKEVFLDDEELTKALFGTAKKVDSLNEADRALYDAVIENSGELGILSDEIAALELSSDIANQQANLVAMQGLDSDAFNNASPEIQAEIAKDYSVEIEKEKQNQLKSTEFKNMNYKELGEKYAERSGYNKEGVVIEEEKDFIVIKDHSGNELTKVSKTSAKETLAHDKAVEVVVNVEELDSKVAEMEGAVGKIAAQTGLNEKEATKLNQFADGGLGTFSGMTAAEVAEIERVVNSQIIDGFTQQDRDNAKAATEQYWADYNPDADQATQQQNINNMEGVASRLATGELEEGDDAYLSQLEAKYEALGLLTRGSSEYLDMVHQISLAESENALKSQEAYKDELDSQEKELQSKKKELQSEIEELKRAKNTADPSEKHEIQKELNAKRAELEALEEDIAVLQEKATIDFRIDYEKTALEYMDDMVGTLVDKTEMLSRASEMIGKGYKVAAKDIEALNQMYPEILDNAKWASDGMLQLNADVVKATLGGEAAMVNANTESTRKALQNKIALLDAEIAFEESKQDILWRLLQGEIDEAEAEKELDASVAKFNGTMEGLKVQMGTEAANDLEVVNVESTNSLLDKLDLVGMKIADVSSAYSKMLNGEEVDFTVGGKRASMADFTDQGVFDDFVEGLLNDENVQKNKKMDDETKRKYAEQIANSQKTINEKRNLRNQYYGLLGSLSDANYDANKAAREAGTDRDSKGSDKDKDKDKMETLDEEKDLYRDINNEIKRYNDELKKQERISSKLTGKQRLESLEAELDVINKQIDAEQRKLGILKNEQKVLQDILKKDNVKFDDKGYISNYDEALAKKLQALNAQIEAYNDASAEEQEALKETIEAAKAEYEKFKEDLERYQEIAVNEIEDSENAIREAFDKQIEKQIEQFELEVELIIDVRDAERQLQEFKRKYVEGIEDDDYAGMSSFSLEQLSTYTGVGGDLHTYEEKMKTALAEYNKIINGGISSIFGDNAQAALEQYENFRDKVIDIYGNIKDLIDEVNQAQLDGINEANEKFDEQLDKYDDINSALERNLKISKLIQGEENYATQLKYLEQQKRTNTERQNTLKKEIAYWEKLIKQEEAAGRANSDNVKEMRDKLEEAQTNLAETTADSLELIAESYDIAREKLFDDIDKSVTNGWGLEGINQEWELVNENAEMYLDSINSAFELSQLESKFRSSIDNTDSVYAQERLNSLMDKELGKLKEKDKLTKYDVERANKLLDIELKKIALEEAQANKTQMRLRRDSQGNYTYQYVSDQDKVEKARQELEKAENDLYNFDKDAYTKKLEEVSKAWEEYQNDLKELSEKYQDDEEEFLRQKKLLEEKYATRIQDLADQSVDIRYNLQGSTLAQAMDLFGLTQEDINSWSEEEMKEFMSGFIPAMSTGLNAMVENFINGELDNAMNTLSEGIMALRKKQKEETEKAAKNGGLNLDDVKNGADIVTEKFKDINKETDDLVESLTDMSKTLSENVTQAEKFAKNLKDAADATGTIIENGNKMVYGDNPLAVGDNSPSTNKNSTASIGDITAMTQSITSGLSKTSKDITSGMESSLKPINKDVANISKLLESNQSASILSNRFTIGETEANYPHQNPSDMKGYTMEASFDSISGQYISKFTDELSSFGDLLEGGLYYLADAIQASAEFRAVELEQSISNMKSKLEPIEKNTVLLEQTVHITADFPSVVNTEEIEGAFKNLLTVSSQYAMQTDEITKI